MLKQATCLLLTASILAACAGRQPMPVAVSQPQDTTMSCDAIQSEMEANNRTISDLGSEEGGKIAQNIAMGLLGIFIWPLWFAMDFQDAAGKEVLALQNRNAYLGRLAVTKCAA